MRSKRGTSRFSTEIMRPTRLLVDPEKLSVSKYQPFPLRFPPLPVASVLTTHVSQVAHRVSAVGAIFLIHQRHEWHEMCAIASPWPRPQHWVAKSRNI